MLTRRKVASYVEATAASSESVADELIAVEAVDAVTDTILNEPAIEEVIDNDISLLQVATTNTLIIYLSDVVYTAN